MNNLYNKIYKAINEGIIKSLHIDDDMPVNYNHSKIDNNFDIPPKNIFNNKVYAFNTQKATLELYNQILDYAYRGAYQYEYKTINQLNATLGRITALTKNKNADISWINTTNMISFIMKDGTTKYLDNITLNDKHNIRFIVFDMIKNCDHPIIIKPSLDHINSQWVDDDSASEINDKSSEAQCISENDEEYIKKDFDGYNHTYNNINIKNNDYTYHPALLYCIWQSTNDYAGYLPSFGELYFLFANLDLVNYVLRHIGYNEIEKPSEYDMATYISSTECDKDRIWVIETNRSYYVTWKTMDRYALSFFKKL